MRELNKCKEYCNGCGLCHSVASSTFTRDEKGFPVPVLSKDCIEFARMCCPVISKEAEPEATHVSAWGNYEGCYSGYACDSEIRFKGSSGGCLTALAIYLLEQKEVDAVIQVGKDPECAYGTKVYCNRSKKEVLDCVGSRYAVSQPLYEIMDMIKDNETYCFIGRPCDVQALYRLRKTNQQVHDRIKYMFSFFCAGIPSEVAQKKLLKQLQCENNCKELEYRGNGWPGYTTATDINGANYQLSYEESWSKILGRDVRKGCRFCFDGIGLYADIVCADAWYQKTDGKPDFSEHEGRNALIARNKKGMKILQAAEAAGTITRMEYDIDNLTQIQRYQYERRGTMLAKTNAMKILFKSVPEYHYASLKKQAKMVDLKRRLVIFMGTIRRVVQKKI